MTYTELFSGQNTEAVLMGDGKAGFYCSNWATGDYTSSYTIKAPYAN